MWERKSSPRGSRKTNKSGKVHSSGCACLLPMSAMKAQSIAFAGKEGWGGLVIYSRVSDKSSFKRVPAQHENCVRVRVNEGAMERRERAIQERTQTLLSQWNRLSTFAETPFLTSTEFKSSFAHSPYFSNVWLCLCMSSTSADMRTGAGQWSLP